MSDTGILVSLEDEDAYRSSVVLDYTSRDFTAIRAQLVGLAQGLMPDWETVGEASDFGTLLLELFSYMGDVMHFYIDRTASEAFLGTALRRQSVLYIADMLGYRPIGQQAASVNVEFTLDSNATASVTIPSGARVYNEANSADDLVVFETNIPVTIAPGETISVFTTEGITQHDRLLGVSKGAPNAEYVIPDKGVVFNTVSIRSNEAGQTLPWAFVTDLSLARPTQPAFTTFLDDADFTHVIFGDNAAGRIPPTNAELFVTYRFGRGAMANDLSSDAINSLAASSVPGVDLWGITVRNPESPTGGTDPETVDAMRQSIPRAAARIKSRAVTLNDYADLAMQVPGVAKSVAHGTVYTAVHVRIAPTGGVASTDTMSRLIASVEDYMKDKIIVGSTVYADPDDIEDLWQDVFVRVLVHVTEGFNRTSVRLQVETVIRQLLSFNAVDFGTAITIGKIYRAALAVQGVEYAELMWLNTVEPTLAQDKVMAPITTNLDPTPNSANIKDVHTDPLLIPRIDPPLKIKTANVTNKVLGTPVANTATLTYTNADALTPTFKIGDLVDIAGVDNVFNGRYTVTAATGTTISYAKINANITAATATGTITLVDPHAPELETDYPGLDEVERTHDGLWVWAEGGVPGT
jgi:hypothetical protein